MQNLDFYEGEETRDSTAGDFLQRWMSALLLHSPNLTSLTVRTDAVPWPPVLGLMSLRHLELNMRERRPWLEPMLEDLSFCPCLETFKLGNDDGEIDNNVPSQSLNATISLHSVTTLKSMEVYNWYPTYRFTLPVGCLLRLAMVLQIGSQWVDWQRMGLPLSMLHLVCMKLRAWPAGIGEMSGLQYLYLACKRMQSQDLAVLQHIPHVSLSVARLNTFLLTSGSWESLQLLGYPGFSINFANADAFVRGTKRFLFLCSSQEAEGMYALLRAACMRQWVACYECAHSYSNHQIARFSNLKLCREHGTAIPSFSHERLISYSTNDFWPDSAVYPELYR